jgi:hypothetical protein
MAYEGNAGINNRRVTHIQEVLENLFINLAIHPVINDPPIIDNNGNQLRISKMRDYDGIEVRNTAGLTMSIYPYSYLTNVDGSLTTQSPNASLVFKPYSIGSGGTPLGALDETKAYIMIKMHLAGYNTETTVDPFIQNTQPTTFEFNRVEQTLRQWMEIIRLILVSELRHLPAVIGQPRNLLTNSYVNWINFNTGRWTDEGLIFHTASLLWEVVYYSKRNIETGNLIEVIGGQVGTVSGVPVCYSLSEDRYYNCNTNETLPLSFLVDPSTGTFYDTLNVNVIKIIDLISQSRDDFVTISGS